MNHFVYLYLNLISFSLCTISCFLRFFSFFFSNILGICYERVFKITMFPCWKSQLHSPTVIRFHAVVRPNLRNYWKIQIIIAYYLGTLSVQTLIYWYRATGDSTRNWTRSRPRDPDPNPNPEPEPDPWQTETWGSPTDTPKLIPISYPPAATAITKLIANLHYLINTEAYLVARICCIAESQD